MPDFVPASPASLAAPLDADAVHVWLLAYDRASGRDPLRALLGGYLDVPIERIRFEAGPHGRPFSAAAASAGLAFNWSHSGSHAVAAFARDLPVLGVDLEVARPRHHALALAKRFFSAEEYRQLDGLAPEALEPVFLRLWTAKEAVLKALGEGLQYGLDRVVFRAQVSSVHPIDFQGDAAPAADWQLHPLPIPGAFGCVAWRGEPRALRLFQDASCRAGNF